MTMRCQYDINVMGDREWGGFCEIPHRGGEPPQEEKSCGKTWHFWTKFDEKNWELLRKAIINKIVHEYHQCSAVEKWSPKYKQWP